VIEVVAKEGVKEEVWELLWTPLQVKNKGGYTLTPKKVKNW